MKQFHVNLRRIVDRAIDLACDHYCWLPALVVIGLGFLAFHVSVRPLPLPLFWTACAMSAASTLVAIGMFIPGFIAIKNLDPEDPYL